jgi:hypothetical protein
MSEARYRLWTAGALIAGPALLFVDNLIHPEELGRGNEAEQLAAIAEAAVRWQIAHLIGFVALILVVAAIAGLGRYVWRDRPRLALAGVALGVAGSLGLAFAFALDGFTWGTLGELSSRPGMDDETLAVALDEVQNSGWALPYYGLVVAWLAGMLLLVWGAAPRIGVRAAVLLGGGAILVAFEGAVADNAYFIASSGVFLIGAIDAGVAVLRDRSSDEALPV